MNKSEQEAILDKFARLMVAWVGGSLAVGLLAGVLAGWIFWG